MSKIINSIKNISILVKLFFIPHKNSLVSTVFNTIGLPILMMIFLKLVSGNSGNSSLNIFCGSLIMGMITMPISTVSIKINNLIVGDGMEFFLSYAITKTEFIIGIYISMLIIYIPSGLVTLICGRLLFNVSFIISDALLAYLATYLCITIMLLPIGIILGFKLKNYNSVMSVSNIMSYGILLLTPIYYDVNILPHALAKISSFIPTCQVSLIMHSIFDGNLIVSNVTLISALIAVLVLSIGCIFVSRLVKWSL